MAYENLKYSAKKSLSWNQRTSIHEFSWKAQPKRLVAHILSSSVFFPTHDFAQTSTTPFLFMLSCMPKTPPTPLHPRPNVIHEQNARCDGDALAPFIFMFCGLFGLTNPTPWPSLPSSSPSSSVAHLSLSMCLYYTKPFFFKNTCSLSPLKM